MSEHGSILNNVAVVVAYSKKDHWKKYLQFSQRIWGANLIGSKLTLIKEHGVDSHTRIDGNMTKQVESFVYLV